MGVEPVARRGLAFADPHNASHPSTENSNTSRRVVTYPESVHAMPPSTLQHCEYQKSAFQPVKVRSQDQLTASNYGPPQGSRILDISSCNDAENVLRTCKPANEVKPAVISHAGATQFNDSVFTLMPNSGNPGTADKFKVALRTPDANRSGDFNNSNLTGPSPTVFTKQALRVVGDMFSGPLDSERDLTLALPQEPMDQIDKDFEAAFSNDDCTSVNPFSTGLGAMGRLKNFKSKLQGCQNKPATGAFHRLF